jgi:sec-independent protein translocase protein TatA
MPNVLAMIGLGYQELLIILLIVIVIFGARKLPELGRGLGEGLKNFRKGVKDASEAQDEDGNQSDRRDGTSANG